MGHGPSDPSLAYQPLWLLYWGYSTASTSLWICAQVLEKSRSHGLIHSHVQPLWWTDLSDWSSTHICWNMVWSSLYLYKTIHHGLYTNYIKLICTSYTNEDDIAKHIAKMQELHQHLVMLGCNLPNNLFTVFLQLSMPQDWNYIFTGPSEDYGSNEIKCCIWEEYAVHCAHKSSATASAVSQSCNNRSSN